LRAYDTKTATAQNQIQKETPRARKTKRTRTMHPTPKKRTRRRRLKEISSGYFSKTHHSANQNNLSRLVQNIRLRDASSNNGASRSGLTKDWDFSIEEKEAEFREDQRETSGIGRKRKRVSELAYARFFC
jgi:hypothetical protein